jgi:hypothetical protein
MKIVRWNLEKAKILVEDPARGGVGFEEAVVAIESGAVLDIIANPVRENQRMFVLEIDGYAYVVPFVENDEGIFLKTVYPSRKYTAHYLSNKPRRG